MKIACYDNEKIITAISRSNFDSNFDTNDIAKPFSSLKMMPADHSI